MDRNPGGVNHHWNHCGVDVDKWFGCEDDPVGPVVEGDRGGGGEAVCGHDGGHGAGGTGSCQACSAGVGGVGRGRGGKLFSCWGGYWWQGCGWR